VALRGRRDGQAGDPDCGAGSPKGSLIAPAGGEVVALLIEMDGEAWWRDLPRVDLFGVIGNALLQRDGWQEADIPDEDRAALTDIIVS
jgi:hypothetical protein